MGFSKEALAVISLEFCNEFEAIMHQTDAFLTQFHIEERLQFADAEKIQKQYLSPYASLAASLLASLSRTDEIALRLGRLLECSFCTQFAQEMACVETLFSAYERYRAATADYLATSQKNLADKQALSSKGISSLIASTRAIRAVQVQARESFLPYTNNQ